MASYGPLIKDFVLGQRVVGVPLFCCEANPCTTKAQKPFIRFVFRDGSGSVNGIRWDAETDGSETGTVLLVTGAVGEYNGQPQIKVDEAVLLEAPEPEVLARLQAVVDDGWRTRLVAILRHAHERMPASFWQLFVEALGEDPFDLDGAFWTFPAAQQRHHAERGGLAWHTLSMLAHADAVAPFYDKLDIDLLRLAVLTHDLGKLDCYDMSPVGARRLPADRSVGHTAYSIARVHGAIVRLRRLGCDISAADEENLLHCIASHHGRQEWGAICDPDSPEAAALHALDYLDSHLRPVDQRPDPPPTRDQHVPALETAPADTATAPRRKANGARPPRDGGHDDGTNGANGQPSLF